MGSRGSMSSKGRGISPKSVGNFILPQGQAVLRTEQFPTGEPGKRRTEYLLTGFRNVENNWDEDGNRLKVPRIEKMPVRERFSTKAEAIAYAKDLDIKYTDRA